jgi:hypothetical protein
VRRPADESHKMTACTAVFQSRLKTGFSSEMARTFECS